MSDSSAIRVWCARILLVTLAILLFFANWKTTQYARVTAFVCIGGAISQIALNFISRKNSHLFCACLCFICAFLALGYSTQITALCLKMAANPAIVMAAGLGMIFCILIFWLEKILSPALARKDAKWRVAIHETGHAMSLALLKSSPSCKASFSSPDMIKGECEIDWDNMTPEEKRVFLLGGLVSEMLFLGDSEGGWQDMADFRKECEKENIDYSPELEKSLRQLALLAMAGKSDIANGASLMLAKGFLSEKDVQDMCKKIRSKMAAIIRNKN